MNEMVGVVTVTVPNDDLAGSYAELSWGSRVELKRDNVEAFLRWRDTAVPFSNNGRMERQQAYSTEFLEIFRTQAAAQPEAVWEQIESLHGNIQTSITKAQYLHLLKGLSEYTFSEAYYDYLEGTDVVGDVHDEVRPNQEQQMQTILKLFCLQDEE